MSEQRNKTYALNGEAETRIETEFQNLYKVKMDEQLEKKFTVPNVQTCAKEKPFLVKTGGNWYIYIRIDDALFQITDVLTAV